MTDFGFIVSRLLPVLLLIGLGLLLRRTGVVKAEETGLIKKLIINAGLPAVLGLSFYRMDLDASLLAVIAGMFLLNILLYRFGRGVARLQGGVYTPFLYTGFEYGMFSVGLFATAYGADSLPYIAAVDLGHELFIWFVFVTLLVARGGEKRSLKDTLGSFFRSPVILAILAGLGANGAGFLRWENTPLWGGLVATLESLGAVTGPLILITIGAGLTFGRRDLKFAFTTAAVRIPVVLILAYAGGSLLFRKVLGLSAAYEAALFTLLIAPPPFIIPLFMPAGTEEERGRINTTLTVMTLVALGLFILYFAGHPVLTE